MAHTVLFDVTLSVDVQVLRKNVYKFHRNFLTSRVGRHLIKEASVTTCARVVFVKSLLVRRVLLTHKSVEDTVCIINQ